MSVSNRYKYSIELKHLNTKTSKSNAIHHTSIKSMIIDYDYDNTNMPVICITASLDRNFIDTLITTKESALMNLRISKFIDDGSSMNLTIDTINQQFVYFITEEVNYNTDLDYSSGNIDRKDLFKTISIGLMAKTTIDQNSKVFDGILSNTNMLGAIMYCTKHIPNLLFEPLSYNSAIKNLILPKLGSVSKAIAFLNDVCVFYKTSYRFFLDFNYAYIVSSTGKGVLKKGETINTVYIIIKKSGEESGIQQGMITSSDKKYYQISIPGVDTNILKNVLTENLYTNIDGTTVTGVLKSSAVSVNQSSYTTQKTGSYNIKNDNVNKIANLKSDIESYSTTLSINKNDLDSSVFNINKRYQIKNYDKYSDTDGQFLLSRKREFYMKEDENFIMNLMLNFRQILS